MIRFISHHHQTSALRILYYRIIYSQTSHQSICLLFFTPAYLYVDVVFALDDDLDVGIMDGLLVVLYARRPIC